MIRLEMNLCTNFVPPTRQSGLFSPSGRTQNQQLACYQYPLGVRFRPWPPDYKGLAGDFHFPCDSTHDRPITVNGGPEPLRNLWCAVLKTLCNNIQVATHLRDLINIIVNEASIYSSNNVRQDDLLSIPWLQAYTTRTALIRSKTSS